MQNVVAVKCWCRSSHGIITGDWNSIKMEFNRRGRSRATGNRKKTRNDALANNAAAVSTSKNGLDFPSKRELCCLSCEVRKWDRWRTNVVIMHEK